MADEGGFELGRAFVGVDPDATDFDEKLAEQIGSPTVTVTVQADTSGADEQIDEAAAGRTSTITVDADTGAADSSIGALNAKIPDSATITVDADTAAATTSVNDLDGKLAALDAAAAFTVTADTATAAGDLGKLDAEMPADSTFVVTADTAEAVVSLDELDAKLNRLDETAARLNVDANVAEASEALGKLTKELDDLEGRRADVLVGAETGDSGEKLQQLARDADDLQTQLDKLDQGSAQASQALAGLAGSADDASGQLSGAAGDLGHFNEELGATVGDLHDFDEAAGPFVGEASAVAGSIGAMAGAIEGIHGATALAGGGLVALQGQLGDTESAVDTLEGAFGTAGGAITDFSGSVRGESEDAEELAGHLASPRDAMHDLAEESKGAAEELGAVGYSAAGLAGSEQPLTAVGEAAGDMGRGAEDAKSRFSELRGAVDDLGGELGQLDQAFGGESDAVHGLKMDLAGLKAEMEAVSSFNFKGVDTEEAFADWERDIGGINRAVDDLEGTLPAAKQDMSEFARVVEDGVGRNDVHMYDNVAQDIANVGSNAEGSAGDVDKLGASAHRSTSPFHALGEAFMTVASNPFTWIAVAIGGGIALGVELGKVKDQTDNFIDALGRTDHAVGYNVQGFHDYAGALEDNVQKINADVKAGENLRTHQQLVGQALGHTYEMQEQLTGAQKDAEREYTNLSGHLGDLERSYHLTSDQAGDLAEAVKVSYKTLDQGGASAKTAMDKINAYAQANENAQGPVGAMTHDMEVFGNNALTAADHVGALDDDFNRLIGNFVSSQQSQLQVQQDFVTLASNAHTAGAEMGGANQASITLSQSFYNSIGDIKNAAEAMRNDGDSVNQVTQYINTQIERLGTFAGSNHSARVAVQDLKQWEDELKGSADGATQAIAKASTELQDHFIVQVKNAGVQSSTAHTDVDNLATSIENTGTQSNATADARAKLISDLEAAGMKASTAKSDVDHFITSLKSIPSKENTALSVDGHGTWDVKESNIYPTPSGKAPPPPIGEKPPKGTGAAAGMFVTGGIPGVDSVPILAQRGEVVVPEPIVSAGAIDHLRGSIPGFESGGVVGGATSVGGSYGGSGASGLGVFADQQSLATNAAVIYSVEAAMASAINSKIAAAKAAAAGGGGGPVGGDEAKNKAIGEKMVTAAGWGGQFTDFNNIVMAESGWNRTITNGGRPYNSYDVAYGIPQALPASKMGAAANPPTSSASAQIAWMIGYIRSTYGDPDKAWAYHLAHGSYDEGGYLQPGLTLAMNKTGQPERVIGPQESVGNTFVFNGTQYPTPEQMQALSLQLTTAVNMA